MKIRKSVLSVQEKRTRKNVKAIRDNQINYSDIPPLSDKQIRKMRRVGRPSFGESSKLMIAIRLDPKLIEKIKKLADKSKKGYQSLIQEILEDYVENMAA